MKHVIVLHPTTAITINSTPKVQFSSKACNPNSFSVRFGP